MQKESFVDTDMLACLPALRNSWGQGKVKSVSVIFSSHTHSQ